MSQTMRDRIRQCIDASGLTRGAVALELGLSDSQLSKSLGGTRQFSTSEVARLANHLQVSMYWLATGENDPSEYRLVARHSYDHGKQSYSADALQQDRQLLDDVALVYRQAFG